jgi:phosphomannomutase
LPQLEVYVNSLAELQYLQSLSPTEGGIRRGDKFFFAYDLRPSSSQFIGEDRDRGGIAQAVERAIRDAGMKPVNLGAIPTPALAFYALERGKGSIMVTGSHIPFDRNGYKTYSAKGELRKTDEVPINAHAERIRAQLYEQPYDQSPFDRRGLFKCGGRVLSAKTDVAAIAYVRRYGDFFANDGLRGARILVYQHSAVGRDLLVEILQRLGAEAIPTGRVETFVSIDTENIDEEQLGTIQTLVDRASAQRDRLDAIVSTDGDSDRPLVLGLDESGKARFFAGDLLGMIVAEYLKADAVVVPISCNDAVDRGPLSTLVEPKTRIGSPYIVEAMHRAVEKGKRAVCGWEANGGFLTASDIELDGRVLKALPTRDAVLPILGALFSMQAKRVSMVELFGLLPRRFSRSALLRNFPRDKGRQITRRFSPPDDETRRIQFRDGDTALLDPEGVALPATTPRIRMAESLRQSLSPFFPSDLGFGGIVQLDYTDGVRISFGNGDVAHIRPSGNADEFRIYAAADTQHRADEIARLGVADPGGILRRMERAVSLSPEE